ncbi:MAG: hypothetical protein INR65_09890, partial [Gluconacetobacter diazotrophicus]|nr:hypothetical protein [Gluconacetobacter diazotrophicus]
TVFVDGHDATIAQSGSGRQVIVDSPTDGGRLDVSGGAGQQEIWTGNADVHVSAAPAAVPGASLTLLAQHGSTAALSLGGEAATAINQGGTLTVSGAPGIAGGAGTATVFAEGGSTTIAGGGEALVAVMCGGDLSITAGTGNQQIFGGDRATGSLAVMASPTASGGSQTVVDANATVFGGRTNQTIWTGTADDVVVASNRAADAGGHIALLVQGGTSSYWGGTESAQLDNTGGILDAFLGGDGADRIGVDMAAAGGGITILHGFDPARDTLLLRGLPASPDVLHVSTADGATTLAFGTSRVVFADTPAPVASATAGGLLFGHG